jgi:uncharacterized membrane protein YheB (UPF0754 family)
MKTYVPTPEEIRQKLRGEIPKSEVEHKVKNVIDDAADRAHESIERQAKKVLSKLNEDVTRKKLTPLELRQGLDLLFQKYNFSPVEELIRVAQSTDSETTMVSICKFLTEFMIPKVKSVEVSGSVDHNHTVVIRRFGNDGKVYDEELKKPKQAPGVLAPWAPVREGAAAIGKAIDVEASRG